MLNLFIFLLSLATFAQTTTEAPSLPNDPSLIFTINHLNSKTIESHKPQSKVCPQVSSSQNSGAPDMRTCSCQPTKQNNESPKGLLRIQFYLDNDNKVMGAYSLVDTKNDGDDFKGYTHGIGLSSAYEKGNTTIEASFSDKLYTKRVHYDPFMIQTYFFDDVTTSTGNSYTVFDGSGFNLYQGGTAHNGDRPVQRFVDVSRFQASLKQGKDFYFKANVGIEHRARNTSDPLTFGVGSQEFYHKLLGIYTFDNFGPEEQEMLVGPNKVKQEEEYTTIAPNGTTNTHHPYELLPGDVVRPKIEKEKLNENLSKNSLIAGGSVGKVFNISKGSFVCKAETEAGVQISTESNNLIGTNSNAFGKAGISAGIGGNKKKLPEPRIQTSASMTYYYFPTRGVSSQTHSGEDYTLGLKSTHRAGSGILQPFMTLTIPVGRREFDEWQDKDSIMRMGLLFTFDKH